MRRKSRASGEERESVMVRLTEPRSVPSRLKASRVMALGPETSGRSADHVVVPVQRKASGTALLRRWMEAMSSQPVPARVVE
jgi:DnaJ-domain-containing protein 1